MGNFFPSKQFKFNAMIKPPIPEWYISNKISNISHIKSDAYPLGKLCLWAIFAMGIFCLWATIAYG